MGSLAGSAGLRGSMCCDTCVVCNGWWQEHTEAFDTVLFATGKEGGREGWRQIEQEEKDGDGR